MLAQALSLALDGAGVLPLDAYYRDRSSLPLAQRKTQNFDEPNACEHELLMEHLVLLHQGETIARPVYDFATHTRLTDTVNVPASKYLILDGLFSLYWERARQRTSFGVFVDVPFPVALERRILRDRRERGRTEEEIRVQFAATVEPMGRRYVLPSRDHADLVVSGTDDPSALQSAVLAQIS